MTQEVSLSIPDDWRTDEKELEDWAETLFPGEQWGLSGPYTAIMYHDDIDTGIVLIRCGGPETDGEHNLPIYVFFERIALDIQQVIRPTKLKDIVAAMRTTKLGYGLSALELKSDFEDVESCEEYLPIPAGWLAEDKSAGDALQDFPGSLYDLKAPYRPVLRTVDEDLFVISTAKIFDSGPEDSGRQSPTRRYFVFPATVLWDKTSRIMKEFNTNSGPEIAHYMCKEQRQHGKIVWSDKYFGLKLMHPRSETQEPAGLQE